MELCENTDGETPPSASRICFTSDWMGILVWEPLNYITFYSFEESLCDRNEYLAFSDMKYVALTDNAGYKYVLYLMTMNS